VFGGGGFLFEERREDEFLNDEHMILEDSFKFQFDNCFRDL
jgi:hypothetical protein